MAKGLGRIYSGANVLSEINVINIMLYFWQNRSIFLLLQFSTTAGLVFSRRHFKFILKNVFFKLKIQQGLLLPDQMKMSQQWSR